MDRLDKRRILEALILASPEPVSAARLAEILPRAKPGDVRDWVEELNAEYAQQGRAFEIASVAGGYQVRTLPELADYVQRLLPTRPLRLSRAALETLAVVAYRQPITRAEVEHVRGVDVGATLKGLLERQLVRIAGHREVPGKPLLYGTTRRFLEIFGLEKLDDLPSLRSIEELTAEMAQLAAPEGGEPAARQATPDAAAPDAAGTEEAARGEHSGEAPEAELSGELAEVLAEAEPTGKPH